MRPSEEDVIKARRVRAIMDDEVFQEAVERCREVILTKWRATDPNDYQTRETLWMQERGIDDVLRELRALYDRGAATEQRKERRWKVM